LTANDNSAPHPTPIQFSLMISDYANAHASLVENPTSHARLVAAEAARMRLIEAYERAYAGRRLRSV
jgi:hypothetical protein